MEKYAKFIVQVIVTIAAAIAAALAGNEVITATEWVNIAIIGAGALSVFAAPNVPGAAYTKVILAVLTAALTVLVSAIVGGVTVVEWIQILIASAGAVGVYAVPNAGNQLVG